jgi:hypothetical protein
MKCIYAYLSIYMVKMVWSSDVSDCTATSIAAWFDGYSLDGSTWADKSGNGVAGTASGVNIYDGSGAITELNLNGQPVVYGDLNSQVIFDTNIPATHTVFNLCKYRNVGSKGRVVNAAGCNCLFGHHGGVSGVAHENRWITDQNGLGNTWVLSSQTRDKYFANGIDRTLGNVAGTGGGSAVGQLGIRYGQYADQKSDWACAEVLVFYSELPAAEISCIEEYFCAKYGITLESEKCGAECCAEAPGNLCLTGECDWATGSGVCKPEDCDDSDACTVDSCDPATGCVHTSKCNNGKTCDGEEVCDPQTGDCTNGTGVECRQGFTCNEEANGCVRECGQFAIDGYLQDCSAEWNANEIQLAELESKLDTLSHRVDNVDDQILALQGEDDAIYSVLGEYETVDGVKEEPVYAQLDAITRRLDSFQPWLEVGETDTYQGQTAQGVGMPQSFYGANKDDFIVFLLVGNMVLLIVIAYAVCYCKHKSKEKARYERVKYYSSAVDEENASINK